MKKLILPFILLNSLLIFSQERLKDSIKLDEVKIIKQKKAVEQKADRTIFDFAGQAHLNSGSVLEGIKKLPGLITSDIAGMMYQGKQLDVYMDSRPLNISSNELNAFLEGMPANSVERIEVITQPGAEFPATSGGAILNIITNKKAKNYLTATYSSGANFTSYDKLRTKFNNSLLISAKNKYFGWQLNVGQNYRESAIWSEITKSENSQTITLSNSTSDRYGRNYFVKSAITIDFEKDRLLLNYDLNRTNNDAYTAANGLGFSTYDANKTLGLRQEFVATYQKKFDDKNKKLDFIFNFSKNDGDVNLNSRTYNTAVLNNNSDQKYINFKIDYSQPLKILDEGKISAGTLIDKLSFDTQSFGLTNLDYSRQTTSGYVELQVTHKKMDFIIGTRAENYNITGKTDVADLIPFKQFKLFPNASFQYNFAKQINFNANYNKKITLPSTSSLNPNNTNYQNQNVAYSGNPQLQPTIYDNIEFKVSAFDYAFIGYSVSYAKNQVMSRILNTNNQVTNTSLNIPSVQIHNFNIGMPLPYMLFSKGLKETMKFDFNPDKINFLYIYVGNQLHVIPGENTKGFWMVNLMSQIILPKDIKFVTTLNTTTTGGNYYYYIAKKPFNNSLDVSFSKKFLNNQLSVSINVDDILNTSMQAFSASGTPIYLQNKYDTRRFGFTLNYKIPTKNKLAKEAPSQLNKDKKDDGGIIGN